MIRELGLVFKTLKVCFFIEIKTGRGREKEESISVPLSSRSVSRVLLGVVCRIELEKAGRRSEEKKKRKEGQNQNQTRCLSFQDSRVQLRRGLTFHFSVQVLCSLLLPRWSVPTSPSSTTTTSTTTRWSSSASCSSWLSCDDDWSGYDLLSWVDDDFDLEWTLY